MEGVSLEHEVGGVSRGTALLVEVVNLRVARAQTGRVGHIAWAPGAALHVLEAVPSYETPFPFL